VKCGQRKVNVCKPKFDPAQIQEVQMNIRNMLAAAIIALFAGMAWVPSARADEWNQMTELSFSQPVQLPNTVLPAGKYWFVLANTDSNRHVVQVFSSNWSRVYASLITVPTIRKNASSRTEVKFAERPHERPEALLAWYYPGRFTGQEFLYPHRQERRFQRDPKQVVVTPSLTPRS
jgi:hypothetical protein